MKNYLKIIISILAKIARLISGEKDNNHKRALIRAQKAITKMQSYIIDYNTYELDKLKTRISKGNRKIGYVLNVSLPPILTCANCSGCMLYCYDIKAILQYTNVAIARSVNYVILQRDRNKYFSEIRKVLKRRKKNCYFRWHVSGDIIDIDYFENMVKIAKDFPNFKFWTYTKNYKVVNQWIDNNGKENLPENLSIMFSEWQGMKMINPYNLPEFRVIMKGQEKPENANMCPGNCMICAKAHINCVKGETTYVHEH